MIVVLVGESGSGKSTIEKLIEERYPSFSKIVAYTTRPPRAGETDGVDYHFITDEKFDVMKRNGQFLETAEYRGWHYGSAIMDYCDSKNHIAVLTPHGYRSLKTRFSPVCIYFDVDRRSRLIKLLERGDDIDEAYRRSISDVGQFDGFADEADYVIKNPNYKKSIDEVFKSVSAIIDFHLWLKQKNTTEAQ